MFKNHIKNCHCQVCKIIRRELIGSKNPRYIDGRTNKKNRCLSCGKELLYYKSKKCRSCYEKLRKVPKQYCFICNKEITHNASKCQSCAATKHGYYSKSNLCHNKCLDCQKEINPTSKRCKKCSIKERKRTHIKHRNPKICYCIECKKQLGETAYYIGTKRCNSCELRRRYKLGLKNNKGRNSPLFGKIPNHIKRIKYKNYLMRSSYEIAYAKYLDKQGIKWQYEPKTFDLGYTTYTPDFYLLDNKEYIEIKGWFREKDKIKMNNFKIDYPKEKITILMQEDLKQVGVL